MNYYGTEFGDFFTPLGYYQGSTFLNDLAPVHGTPTINDYPHNPLANYGNNAYNRSVATSNVGINLGGTYDLNHQLFGQGYNIIDAAFGTPAYNTPQDTGYANQLANYHNQGYVNQVLEGFLGGSGIGVDAYGYPIQHGTGYTSVGGQVPTTQDVYNVVEGYVPGYFSATQSYAVENDSVGIQYAISPDATDLPESFETFGTADLSAIMSVAVQLTDNDVDDFLVGISNDQIVWASLDGNDPEIIRYAATDSTIQNISSTEAYDSIPFVSGELTIWLGHQGNDTEVFLNTGGETIQLTDNDVDEFGLAVFGNKAAWVAYDGFDTDLFVYDGTESNQLTSDDFNDLSPYIAPNGDIIWYGYNSAGDDNELHLYDGESITQLTDNEFDEGAVAFGSNFVVYQSFDGNDIELYSYGDATTVQITDNNTDEGAFGVSDNFVAYHSFDGEDVELYVFDGTSTIALTNNTVNEGAFAVTDSLVAFQSFDGEDAEWYAYDGVGTIQLTDNSYAEGTFAYSDELFVWESFDGNDSELYVFNGNQTTQLTNDNFNESIFGVLNDQVAWLSFDGNDFEIFQYSPSQGVTQLTDNNVDESVFVLSDQQVAWQSFDGNDSEIFLADI